MEDLVDAKVEKYIAHGVSASVYKARWNNMDCAIKKFKIVKGNGHVVTSPRPKAHPAGSGEAGAGGTDETIDGDAGDTKNEGLEGFRNEVFLLKKLQHENLIAVYAVCDRPQSQLFALVMELMVTHLSDLVPLEIVLHSFSSLVSVIIILPCWSWCSLALSLSHFLPRLHTSCVSVHARGRWVRLTNFCTGGVPEALSSPRRLPSRSSVALLLA